MRTYRNWRWLTAGIGLFAFAALPPQWAAAADKAEKPQKTTENAPEKTSEKAEAPIDRDKAKAIHQRAEQGEKLSAEDQAYYDRAKAALARGEAPGQPKPDSDGIDKEKAKALYQREQAGEKLTAEEQAYLDKVKAMMARRGGDGAARKPADAGAEKPAGDKPAADPIDMQKARALLQKERNGEKLTDEEKAYLEKAKAQRGGGGGARPGNQPNRQPQNAPAARESTGMVPLPQLGAEKYKGFDGGLYGGGKNEPPAAHAKAAADAAAKIVPLDKDGKPDAAGKIVLLSIGMSNTTQEFSRFKQIADQDSAKSPKLVIVDGAQGGKAGEAWAKENPGVWETADQRIAAGGVTAKQVQVVWIKQAEISPSRLGDFPEHAKVLQKDIETILQLARKRFPNLRLAYLSNRIYAGYANGALNPEPYAYESAFADRWVIEKQIAGDASLNYDEAKGEVKSPIVLWGPYLWSDGVKGRKGDELVYTREDLGPDGTHPSNAGRQKVADLLLKFFKSDSTAKGWFLKL